ncbi:MAG: MBL fold metallo-hydrolase [Alphaproteobacteria bacterium]
MAKKSGFEVRFWGVRGGLPCPGPGTIGYGGNTPCVEMRAGDLTLIFDAGTGIRPLGNALDKEAPVAADIFFSHTSFERISGIPFFTAGYNPKNSFRLWAGHLPPGQSVRDVLTGLMTDPVFPVPIDVMGAKLEFRDFRAGETLEPGPKLRVRSAALNRSVPVTGYRVEWDGKSVCYVSDLMPAPDGDEAAAVALADKADVAIVSTVSDGADDAWRQGARLCDAAKVKTYVVFHHPPESDDGAMDAIAAEAEALRPGTIVAREGMTLTP